MFPSEWNTWEYFFSIYIYIHNFCSHKQQETEVQTVILLFFLLFPDLNHANVKYLYLCWFSFSKQNSTLGIKLNYSGLNMFNSVYLKKVRYFIGARSLVYWLFSIFNSTMFHFWDLNKITKMQTKNFRLTNNSVPLATKSLGQDRAKWSI